MFSFTFLCKIFMSLYDGQLKQQICLSFIQRISYIVKSRLSEHRLSKTTGLFEDYGQSRLFSLLSIAIKLPIIRISIIRKIQFFEVIRRSPLKKLLLNKLFKIRSPKTGGLYIYSVTHGDRDFLVWSSSIYTPE